MEEGRNEQHPKFWRNLTDIINWVGVEVTEVTVTVTGARTPELFLLAM